MSDARSILADRVVLHVGDCRAVLATLPAGSANCIVTSPPYFGLRDYGHAEQIGLEPTPDEFVSALVGVFREARRVLRDDGTLWLNLGDSYAGSWGNQGRKEERGTQRPVNGEILQSVHDGRYPSAGSKTGSLDKTPGLKKQRPNRHPVARRLRAASRWLVSSPRHHLVEAEPDAGKRARPLHKGARVRVPSE